MAVYGESAVKRQSTNKPTNLKHKMRAGAFVRVCTWFRLSPILVHAVWPTAVKSGT